MRVSRDRAVRICAVTLAVCCGLAFAAVRVAKEPVDGDVHVFWKAGNDYLHGKPLYDTPPGLLSFIYPPFAALCFAPLGMLPFKTAAFLFFVGNYLAWYFAFVLVATSLRLFHDPGNQMPWVIGIAFAATFKVFLNNLTHIQVNNYVLLPALAAIIYFLKGRDLKAILLAGMATSIKLTPVTLFFWMIARRRSPRFLVACLVAGGLFVLIPAALRGPTQGIADINDYYDTFLGAFVAGGVNTNNSSQTIGGLLMRYCTDLSMPEGDNDGYTFHLVDCDPQVVKKVAQWMSVALLAAVLLSSLLQSRAGIPPNLYEASAYLLTGHLISGVAWKAHLVSLSLPLAVLAADVLSERRRTLWGSFLLAYFCLLGVLGKELVGKKGMIFLGGYGFYTIGMLMVVGTFCVFPFRNLRQSDDESPPRVTSGNREH